eukprot:Nk52_evm10s208 gene=Nk52_evmTU10s208
MKHAYIFTTAGAFFVSFAALVLVIVFLQDISSEATEPSFLWQQWFVSFFIFAVAGIHTFRSLNSRIRPLLPFMHLLAIAWAFDQMRSLGDVVISCANNGLMKFKNDIEVRHHCKYFDIGFSGYIVAFLAQWVYLVAIVLFSKSHLNTRQSAGDVEAASANEGNKWDDTGSSNMQRPNKASIGFRRQPVRGSSPMQGGEVGGGDRRASSHVYDEVHAPQGTSSGGL